MLRKSKEKPNDRMQKEGDPRRHPSKICFKPHEMHRMFKENKWNSKEDPIKAKGMLRKSRENFSDKLQKEGDPRRLIRRPSKFCSGHVYAQ